VGRAARRDGMHGRAMLSALLYSLSLSLVVAYFLFFFWLVFISVIHVLI
jgi:hypothetical protein